MCRRSSLLEFSKLLLYDTCRRSLTPPCPVGMITSNLWWCPFQFPMVGSEILIAKNVLPKICRPITKNYCSIYGVQMLIRKSKFSVDSKYLQPLLTQPKAPNRWFPNLNQRRKRGTMVAAKNPMLMSRGFSGNVHMIWSSSLKGVHLCIYVYTNTCDCMSACVYHADKYT